MGGQETNRGGKNENQVGNAPPALPLATRLTLYTLYCVATGTRWTHCFVLFIWAVKHFSLTIALFSLILSQFFLILTTSNKVRIARYGIYYLVFEQHKHTLNANKKTQDKIFNIGIYSHLWSLQRQETKSSTF